jgi:hypothetical protein
VELGLGDASGEDRRRHPRPYMQSPCQYELFALDQRVAVVARWLSCTLKGNAVATARRLLARRNLSGGLLALNAVGAARRLLARCSPSGGLIWINVVAGRQLLAGRQGERGSARRARATVIHPVLPALQE